MKMLLKISISQSLFLQTFYLSENPAKNMNKINEKILSRAAFNIDNKIRNVS